MINGRRRCFSAPPDGLRRPATIPRLLDCGQLISRDARGRHCAGDGRHNRNSVWLILNEGKGSFIVVSAAVHGDLFADVCGPDKDSAACTWPSDGFIGVECPRQCKVIELVRGATDLLPHAHTERASSRSTTRVHQLRSIAMPRDVSRIERPDEGAGRRELELPQAHDVGDVRIIVRAGVIVAGDQYKQWLSGYALGLAGSMLRADGRSRCLPRKITAAGVPCGQSWLIVAAGCRCRVFCRLSPEPRDRHRQIAPNRNERVATLNLCEVLSGRPVASPLIATEDFHRFMIFPSLFF